MQKTEALVIVLSRADQERLSKNFPLTWAKPAIKHLGVRIPSDPNDILKVQLFTFVERNKAGFGEVGPWLFLMVWEEKYS